MKSIHTAARFGYEYWRSVWLVRAFLLAKVRTDLQAKTRGYLLGSIWNLVPPLLNCAFYGIFFGIVLDLHRDVDDYPSWLITGVLTYHVVASSVTRSVSQYTRNESLLLISGSASGVITASEALRQAGNLYYSFAAFFVAFMLTDITLLNLALWPFSFSLLLLLVPLHFFGIVLLLETVGNRSPAIREVMPFITRLGRFSCGVLIPLDRLLGWNFAVDFLLRYNPVTVSLEITRCLTIGAPLRSGTVYASLVWCVGWNLMAMIIYARIDPRSFLRNKGFDGLVDR